MAITPRASTTLALATRVNTTVSRPAGTVTGDYLVVAMDVGGSSAATITPPAGWTQLGTITFSNLDPWSVVLQMWGRFDDGAASWTWTHVSRSTQAYCTAYIGVDPTTPVDVAATTAGVNNTTSGTTIVAPSQDIVTAGARGIIARGSWDGNAITPPAGWSERLDTPVLWVGDRDWVAAGATGTVTVDAGNGGFHPRGIIMAALRPAGAAGPNEGSGSGSWTFIGTASGSRPSEGAGSGAFNWAGSATGSRMSSGSATGEYSWTGSADGEMRPSGTGAGSWGFVGQAEGSRPSEGSAAGGWQFEGSAAGTAPPVSGSGGVAVGSWQFVGSAEGSRTSAGTAAGAWSFAGTAVGEAPGVPGSSGSASGSWSFSGSAVGSRPSSGSAFGTFTWVGTAVGDNGEVIALLVTWVDDEGITRSGRLFYGDRPVVDVVQA